MADKSIQSAARLETRTEDIRSRRNIVKHQVIVHLRYIRHAATQRGNSTIVVVGMANRLLEDNGVRCNARQSIPADETRKLPACDHLALYEIEPDALAQLPNP